MASDLQPGDRVTLIQRYHREEVEPYALTGRLEMLTKRIPATVHWTKRDGSVQVTDDDGARYMVGPDGYVRSARVAGTVRLERP